MKARCEVTEIFSVELRLPALNRWKLLVSEMQRSHLSEWKKVFQLFRFVLGGWNNKVVPFTFFVFSPKHRNEKFSKRYISIYIHMSRNCGGNRIRNIRRKKSVEITSCLSQIIAKHTKWNLQ